MNFVQSQSQMQDRVMAQGPDVNHLPTFGSTQAMMWIFPPRKISQQVLHPYTYKFDTSFAETLADSMDMLREIGPMGSLYGDPRLNNAIVPNSNGIPLDVKAMEECYTGILLIDVEKPDSMGILPNTRTIYSGVFIDEPFSTTNVFTSERPINPHALFNITHRSVINKPTMYTPQGAQGNATLMLGDDDVIFQSIANMAPSDNLYVIAPHKLRMANFNLDADNNVVDGSSAAVASLSMKNEILPNRLKSPMSHLRSVVKQLNYARNLQCGGMQYGQELDGTVPTGDPVQQFAARVDTGLCSDIRQSMMVYGQLDPNQIYEMQHIQRLFPYIEFTLLDIPYHQEYDVASQLGQNPSTTMSTMITNTIGTLAFSVGIANVSFRYSSWQKSQNQTQLFVDSTPGVFELYNIGMIVESNEFQIKCAWDALCTMMNSDLFPILKTVGGEFDIMINLDVQGEVMLWFEYLDIPSGQQGFYQSNNRFGGVLNPMLGNEANLKTNGDRLQQLTSYIASNAVGHSEIL